MDSKSAEQQETLDEAPATEKPAVDQAEALSTSGVKRELQSEEMSQAKMPRTQISLTGEQIDVLDAREVVGPGAERGGNGEAEEVLEAAEHDGSYDNSDWKREADDAAVGTQADEHTRDPQPLDAEAPDNIMANSDEEHKVEDVEMTAESIEPNSAKDLDIEAPILDDDVAVNASSSQCVQDGLDNTMESKDGCMESIGDDGEDFPVEEQRTENQPAEDLSAGTAFVPDLPKNGETNEALEAEANSMLKGGGVIHI